MTGTKTPEQITKEADEANRKELEKRAAEQAKNQKDHPKPTPPPHGTAPHKESKGGGATVGGAVNTYDAKTGLVVDSRGPPEERAFTLDEIKSLGGDIHRGELAHIELDENGTPTGVAFRGIPGPDQTVAPVYGTPLVQFDELVTPSGAPITKYMNPEPVLWDAGMLARNPIPEGGKRVGPVGGGVVNQPVTTG